MDTDRRPKDIPSLTGLRGIAATWVLGYHVLVILKTINPDVLVPMTLALGGGYLGVDIFFVLSGFVLAYNYGHRAVHASVSSYVRFLWMRLARIYPVHVAALALVFVSMLVHFSLGIPYSTDHTLGSLLKSLALTHAWSIPVRGMWNAPSWSLSAEWAAYLAFPLIVAIAMKLRSRVAILACLIALMGTLSFLVELRPQISTMYFGMHRIAAEFTAGVLIFRLWSLGAPESRTADLLATLSLTAMLTLSGALDYFTQGHKALVLLPPLACGVIFLLASARGILSSFLSSPLMLYLGRVSYSLYMVHFSFLILAKNYVTHEFSVLPTGIGLGVAVAFVAASFICAHCFYVSIEEPARRKMLSLLTERGSATGAICNTPDPSPRASG